MIADKYTSLITSQHRKPRFTETVRVAVEPILDCTNFLKKTNELFDLNVATGLPLQVIADWVGAPNSIPNSISIAFFGYQQQPESLPMRESTDPSFLGGFWRESGVSGFQAVAMSKELFQRVVKAKIKLNQSDCTLDSAKEIISMVLDKSFLIRDNFDMTVTFEFLGEHDASDQELVKLMFPLSSGVKLLFNRGGEDDY